MWKIFVAVFVVQQLSSSVSLNVLLDVRDCLKRQVVRKRFEVKTSRRIAQTDIYIHKYVSTDIHRQRRSVSYLLALLCRLAFIKMRNSLTGLQNELFRKH